ncbi:MAG: preQ(1) synthase [Candidatus Omnitrophota bacterium]
MIYEDRISSSQEKKAKKTSGKEFFPKDIDASILKTIDYHYPYRKISVQSSSGEFTCLCPFSGLPDFARLNITYVPRRKLIELKSLKFYFYSFRSVKIYNEHVVNKILEDLKNLLNPHEISVTGEFTSRGGICNKVTASYKAKR